MTTLTRDSKSVKPARPFSCSIITLTIEISDTRYHYNASVLSTYTE